VLYERSTTRNVRYLRPGEDLEVNVPAALPNSNLERRLVVAEALGQCLETQSRKLALVARYFSAGSILQPVPWIHSFAGLGAAVVTAASPSMWL
jgi:hypothetical protein